jgi:hypothetical protein
MTISEGRLCPDEGIPRVARWAITFGILFTVSFALIGGGCVTAPPSRPGFPSLSEVKTYETLISNHEKYMNDYRDRKSSWDASQASQLGPDVPWIIFWGGLGLCLTSVIGAVACWVITANDNLEL